MKSSTIYEGKPLLVGAWASTPLKNISLVSWDDEIPDIWENKNCSKPPTSQYIGLYNPFWSSTNRGLAATAQMASNDGYKNGAEEWLTDISWFITNHEEWRTGIMWKTQCHKLFGDGL